MIAAVLGLHHLQCLTRCLHLLLSVSRWGFFTVLLCSYLTVLWLLASRRSDNSP